MRRLIITSSYAGSGGGEVALLRHLDHSTLDPSAIVVALVNDGPLATEIARRGVRCEVIGRRTRGAEFPGPRETWLLGWRLARLARLVGADRVLAYTVPDLEAALVGRLFRAFQVFWRSQGELTVFAPQCPGARDRRLIKLVVRHGVRVISSTCWDADALVRWGVDRSDVRSVPYGIDDEWFDAPLRRDTGAPFRIAFSGRLVPWKGHRVLLDALSRLDAAGFSQWEALIIGGGDEDYRRDLESIVRTHRLEARVRFVGHVAAPRDLVAGCDVLVHASEREPFGLVVAEAMSLGVPVIASDTAGPREIVRPGETGWLVGVGDAEGLAARLVALMRDPEGRRVVARRAQADVSKRYRADQCIPRLEALVFEESSWEGGAECA
jgi:glycosyltransferase involved in cell wall biosynthesis